MSDVMQSMVRSGLKIGGTYLVTKGLTDDGTAQTITGGVLAIVGLLWSHFFHTAGTAAK